MKSTTQFNRAVLLGTILLWPGVMRAQRQMEKLGRGVVAIRTNSTTVYVGWRMLGTDPDNIGFNLYRSAAGGSTVQLTTNQTQTTDFLDAGANLTVTNSYFVKPVTNGTEWAASASFVLPANAPVRQYLAVPLHAVTGGAYPPYDVKFCWVGDLDGDGEYDFVVDRLSTITNGNQYVQAYRRDGTFLWQVDMGFNSTNQYNIEPGSSAISTGHGDKVTVYDMDGDGRAEVLLCTANGVVLGDGSTVTAADNTTQFISVLNGLTGAELARATVPNPYFSDGPFNGHFGIMYCDGVRPSLVFEGSNRIGSGAFNLTVTTWDYRNGALTQRWTWNRGSQKADDFHQIRIADVDHDGKDEFCEGSYVIDDNGQMLFTTELVHGDRFHITDFDPNRPGLETFAIQQSNPSMLGMALYESGTGKMIKKWYQSAVGDVGRGEAVDLDPRYKGVEMYSTMGGIYDCKGNKISSASPWPPEGLWWDADLLREFIDGAGSGAYNPVVNKFNYSTGGADRLYSIYNEGVHQAYGGRSVFWGDILGDWREELVLVANDFSEIRIYTTRLPATSRLRTLMHDPAYRCQATCKGYYQASYTDYYLGVDMQPPAPLPMSDATLVWRGDGGSNVWDVGTTVNWSTNWLWATNTPAATFSSGDTVLFDITGSNNVPINLAGALAPGAVTVYSPKDYVLAGSGSLTGAMKLTKAGRGALRVGTTNDFTGSTLVAEGALIVNGSLSNSPVTVRGGVWLDGRIGGNGTVGAGVTAQPGGGVSPGNGTNAPGTLTIAGGLTLSNALNDFDLSDDPSGTTKTNDRVNVTGNLILQGTNTLVIHLLNGSLSPGTYTLITYTGTLTGGLTNLAVTGLDGVPVELANLSSAIALTVKNTRAPASLVWAGSPANDWDLVISSNWLNGASHDWFVPQDNVRFDNSGSVSPTVNLVGALNPASVTVDATANYAFSGNGSIIGPCGLTKTNSGKLTILTDNEYTGRTIVSGGTLEVSGLSEAGSPGPLGSAGVSPTNLVFYGSTLRVTGDQTYTDRSMTLASGMTTVEVATAGYLANVAGQITGSGGLAKTGAGTLILSTNNTFSGGTVIKAGAVQLASENANLNGVGSGLVTLDGGTLNMLDDSSSYSTIQWNVMVPTSSTGTLNADSRCDLYGTLTGGGTLTFRVPYVRTTLYGDWSAFTGRVNVTTDSDGGDFRINNNYGYANAAVNLATRVNAYRNGGGSVSIGELSGSFGSILSGATAWSMGGKSTDATFAGTISSNSITKVGNGTWTLTGTNSTYSGGTTVSSGALLVNNIKGSGTGSGAVTVAGGGTLGGTGIISGPVTVNGILSPGGDGVGTLTISNNLVVTAGATLQYTLGTSSDRTAVSGNLTLGGTLNISNGVGFTTNAYILFTYGGALTDNGLTIGSAPAGYNYSIDTGTIGRVKLVVSPLTAFQQWQMNYFNSTSNPAAAADADPDGDGLSNTNEFLAGTNPTNSMSGLRILSVVPLGNHINVTWATAGGRTNVVQAATGDAEGGYDTNFTDLSGLVIISGAGDATTNYLDVGAATNAPSRYYRVRLLQ